MMVTTMSDYRSKLGPIPADAFENDMGAPNPKRVRERTSEEGQQAFNEIMAKANAEADALTKKES